MGRFKIMELNTEINDAQNEEKNFVEIPILKKYMISMDSRQYIIRKYNGVDPETGEKKWSAGKYYTTIEGLLKGIVEIGVRKQDIKSFEEFTDVVVKSSELIASVAEQISQLVPKRGL